MTIHTGDCITVMAAMEPDSVDAVVTDPPYGLEFMGKAWDGPKLWGRFDGEWKDRPKGGTHPFANDRPIYKAGSSFQAWCEAWGREALRVTKPGGYLLAFGGTRTHHRLVCGLEDAGWIIRDELTWVYASGFPKGKANLKPAHEPIVLARKPGPLRPLAIDACRIGTDPAFTDRPGQRASGGLLNKVEGHTVTSGGEGRWPSNLLLSDPELFDQPNPYVVGSGAVAPSTDMTKWTSDGQHQKDTPFGPAGFATTYGDSGGYSRFFIVPKADRGDREPVLRGQLPAQPTRTLEDNGRTLRTGSGNERNTTRANGHPTVKPTDLMRHLVRLVTPTGGTVLDCFLGSGSTAIAAELEGFAWVGIEKEPEYVAIAEARLNGTQRGLGLDVPAPTRQPKTIGQQGPWTEAYSGYSQGWGKQRRPEEPEPEEVA